MGPAREGDQLREDFLETVAQNILLDIKLAVSSSTHEAVQKSPPPHHQQAYTHIWEDSDLILSFLSLKNPSSPLWPEPAPELGNFPVPSRPLSTKSSPGNWGVIIEVFSDWPQPNLAECGFGIFRIPSQPTSFLCNSEQQLLRPPWEQDDPEQSPDSGGPRPDRHGIFQARVMEWVVIFFSKSLCSTAEKIQYYKLTIFQ